MQAGGAPACFVSFSLSFNVIHLHALSPLHVHKGFHSLYTSPARDEENNMVSAGKQVLDAVSKLLNQYKEDDISVTVTGHSLGPALATLNAADIVANGKNKIINPETSQVLKEIMVTAFVFASPMVGNSGFKAFFEGLPKLHLLHINHLYDGVPELPIDLPRIFYTKIGILKVIDSIDQNVLNNLLRRPFQIKTYFHNLKNLLNLIPQESTARSGNQVYHALEEDNGKLKLRLVPVSSEG